MEFKNCVTWKEIIQQPSIWKEELQIVKENLEKLGEFIEGVKGKKVKVVFTGAGSSEFVGNTFVHMSTANRYRSFISTNN